jgi:hypothetical protein
MCANNVRGAEWLIVIIFHLKVFGTLNSQEIIFIFTIFWYEFKNPWVWNQAYASSHPYIEIQIIDIRIKLKIALSFSLIPTIPVYIFGQTGKKRHFNTLFGVRLWGCKGRSLRLSPLEERRLHCYQRRADHSRVAIWTVLLKVSVIFLIWEIQAILNLKYKLMWIFASKFMA